MLLLGLFLLTSAVSSCTVILPAQAGGTNLWQVLAELSSAESPLVLCIEGSSPERRFTLDDDPFGCSWATAETIITYLPLSSHCIQEPCVKETIWFLQSNTCYVQSVLTFVNVTLSGQHYFHADCEQDWCTHCLDLALLVMEPDGTYKTVIDGHVVLPEGEEYELHLIKCQWGRFSNDAFMVLEGAQLSFESCSIVDMRSRWSRFVFLLGSLVIRNTNIERIDTSEAFIETVGEDPFVLLEDCMVTGLNRDHAYNPEFTLDTGLLAGSATVVMRRVLLQDNLMLQPPSSKHYTSFITAGQLQLELSQFRRCTGTIEAQDVSLTDVLVQGHFAREIIIVCYENLTILRSQFIANHAIRAMLLTSGQLIDSSLFLNNRVVGFVNEGLLFFTSGLPILTNCSFQANGALDFSFEDYWSVYYIRQGLLNDNGLSAEMQTWARNSKCNSLISTAFLSLTLLDSIISDQNSSTPCLNALQFNPMYSYSQSLGLIRNSYISSRGDHCISANTATPGTFTLENSVFEGGKILLEIWDIGGSSLLLNAINVTFQGATGTIRHSAAVSLSSMSGRFLSCQWLDNQGQDAGGVAVSTGSLWMRECAFRNNSCWANAGDVYMSSEDEREVDIAGCSFEDSKSSLSAASLLFRGQLSGRVENCSFTGSKSESGTVLRIAHIEGMLKISALMFTDLDLPGASVVHVSAATEAYTVLEGLQVVRCSFLRGFVIDSGKDSPTVLSNFNLFASNNGTAILLATGIFSDVGSLFEGNTVMTELYFQGSNTSATFFNSVFRQNRPSDTVGMIYIEGPKTSVQFIDCTFSENNWPSSNGVVRLQPGASARFLNCEFRGHTSVVIVSQTLVVVAGCSFEDNNDLLRVEVGEALLSESSFTRVRPSTAAITMHNSNLTLLRCNLSEVIQGPVLSAMSSQITLVSVSLAAVQYTGDLISLVDSSLQISQSSLNSVFSGGSLLTLSLGTLTLSQVRLLEVHAAVGLFTLTESTVYFTQVEVANSTSQVMRASFAPFISFESCTFAEISTHLSIGVLSCLTCGNLTINNCSFVSISAELVGGISVENMYTTIANSNFTSLRGRDSGAIRLSTTTALLAFTNFHNSTAKWAGGGLHLSAQSAQLQHCSFRFNTAQSGGGLYWTLAEPVLIDVHFANNEANYGPNQASYTAQLQTTNSSLVLASGQVFAEVLVVYIQDHIGQVVRTDSQTRASLSGVGLSGKLDAVAVAGKLEFSGFTAIATPGSHLTLSVSTDSLSLQLTFKFRLCLLGEKLENNACVRCPVGSYSFVSNSTACLLCPNTAECPGDGQLYPKPGYWRSSEVSDLVQACGRPQACLGHEGFESKTGKCAQLYTGKRCQTCEESARRSGRDQCSPCPASGAMAWQACLVGGGLSLLWLGQVTAPERGKVVLRTVQHYLQLTALVADFNLDWPGKLQQFFSLHRYLGNALQYFLPVQCLSTQSFLSNALALMLSPFAVAAVLAVLSLVPGIRGKLINSILVSCLYLHPFLLRESVSLWYCVDDGTSSWLRSDLKVRCWTSSHRLAALAVGLPGLLLWGLGIPAAALIVLMREKGQPSAGSLGTGYRDNCSWWGGLLLLWTSVLAVLYVFSANWGTFNQALTVVLVLSGAAALHVQVGPYRAAYFNKWELMHLLTVLSTAYSGLYFSVIGESNALLSLLFAIHFLAVAAKLFFFGITRLYFRFRKPQARQVTSLI